MMMKNYDELIEINYNPNWFYNSQQRDKISTIGGSASGTCNALLNLIKHQQKDLHKIYLYVKDPFKSKYQLLINGREQIGTK